MVVVVVIAVVAMVAVVDPAYGHGNGDHSSGGLFGGGYCDGHTGGSRRCGLVSVGRGCSGPALVVQVVAVLMEVVEVS